MKKTILWSIILLLPLLSMSQSTKKARGFLKFGTGLYLDISELSYAKIDADPFSHILPQTMVPGQTLWIEGGYKLSNNLILTANVMFASLKRKYIDLIYQGQKHLTFHQNYSLNVGYEFNLGKNNKFMPEIGLLYNRRSTTTAEYYGYIHDDGSITDFNPYISDINDAELGINLSLDYYYQLKSNLFVGVRANAIYLLGIGMEGLSFTPIVGVKF